MANTTVTTRIVVQFDDQFSDAAKRALEQNEKIFKEAKKKVEGFKPIWEPIYQEYFKNIRKDLSGLNALDQTEALSLMSTSFFGLRTALTAFYDSWSAGSKLSEWMVGDQSVEEYADGVQKSFDQLANAQLLALPPIPPETARLFETTKTCLEHIRGMREILITVNLLDNATGQAKVIRKGIEEIFSRDITQRITIIEETIRSAAHPFSGSSDSFSFFDDGLPVFQTSSPDLTGFNQSVGFSQAKPALPGFANGIDRVPRDMLALIHKDEAVLPKNRADDFRRGGSGGVSIKNLNFSFNVSNGTRLDREEFRNMAFMMRDELKRLDRRIN